MWYEIKQKQQKMPKAQTREHERIQQYAFFHFYFSRWNDFYTYHELPGMWYEIKEKQQKLFSGLIFEDEMNAREWKKDVGKKDQVRIYPLLFLHSKEVWTLTLAAERHSMLCFGDMWSKDGFHTINNINT